MRATILALTIVTLAEASIGIFVKLVGSDVSIFTLNFYRVLFATLFLAVTLPFFQGALKLPKHNLRDILIIGALLAVQISLFNIALSLTPVANAVVFWSVAPFFVFIFSSLFLNERPKAVHAYIFALAILGILAAEPVSFGDAFFAEENLGNLIALLTGAIYAALVTYLRSEGKTEPHIDIFWIMLAATFYLSPAIVFFGFGNLFAASANTLFGLTVPVLLWVLGLGVISTGIAFLFIAKVLPAIDANTYSLVDVIVSPIVAALLAFLVLSEVPSENLIYGGAVLLISGFWLTKVMSKRKKEVQEVQRAVPGK